MRKNVNGCGEKPKNANRRRVNAQSAAGGFGQDIRVNGREVVLSQPTGYGPIFIREEQGNWSITESLSSSVESLANESYIIHTSLNESNAILRNKNLEVVEGEFVRSNTPADKAPNYLLPDASEDFLLALETGGMAMLMFSQ